MSKHEERMFWGLILVVAALIYIIMALEVYGQEVHRPSARIAPGPDSTPTPTPTPTPIPDPVERQCAWIQTPWGGSQCDVREACSLVLMPMHIGAARTVDVRLHTDQTEQEVWKPVSGQGPIDISIEWEGKLKFAEWYVDHRPAPVMGCYCDERRDVVVICTLGKYEREVD